MYSLNYCIVNELAALLMEGHKQKITLEQGGDCYRSGEKSETRHREYHKLDFTAHKKVVSAVKPVYTPAFTVVARCLDFGLQL